MESLIDFRVVEGKSLFRDPFNNFQPTSKPYQVRFDPLTGRSGHVSHFGAITAQKLDLASYDRPEVKGFCPFCGAGKHSKTPMFMEDILPGGRLSKGQALLVPNLFPYDSFGAVLIMTDNHVVALSELSREILSDALSVGTEFLTILARVRPELPCHLMTWNYMPPSGGGLVHPHQQYFATEYPGNDFADSLSAAAAFYERHGRDYWSELVAEEERRRERFIGRTGSVAWLASFVSRGVLGEVLAVIPGCYSIVDVTPTHVEDLTAGFLNLFAYYLDRGVYSFNASWVFGPPGQRHSVSCFRIIARTFLNTRDFASDLNFFQALLSEPISLVVPEDLCAAIRPYFKNSDER